MKKMKFRNIMFAGAGSRVGVVILGCVLPALHFVPKLNTLFPNTDTPEERKELAGVPRVIDPWYRWDARWYARISQEGYLQRPGYNSLAFLPLLPLVMALGTALGLDQYWVGLIVPNVAFVVGLGFFARSPSA